MGNRIAIQSYTLILGMTMFYSSQGGTSSDSSIHSVNHIKNDDNEKYYYFYKNIAYGFKTTLMIPVKVENLIVPRVLTIENFSFYTLGYSECLSYTDYSELIYRKILYGDTLIMPFSLYQVLKNAGYENNFHIDTCQIINNVTFNGIFSDRFKNCRDSLFFGAINNYSDEDFCLIKELYKRKIWIKRDDESGVNFLEFAKENLLPFELQEK